MNVIVDPEFRDILNPPSEEGYYKLKMLVADNGFDPPVGFHEDGQSDITLTDGHTRLRIFCEINGLDPDDPANTTRFFMETGGRVLPITDRAEALEWVIKNQIDRRTTHLMDRTYLIGLMYGMRKAAWGGDRKADGASGNDCHLKPATEIAQEFDISERTVRYCEEFAQAIDKVAGVIGDEFKQDVLGGMVTVSRKRIIEAAKYDNPEDINRALYGIRTTPRPKTITTEHQFTVFGTTTIERPESQGVYEAERAHKRMIEQSLPRMLNEPHVYVTSKITDKNIHPDYGLGQNWEGNRYEITIKAHADTICPEAQTEGELEWLLAGIRSQLRAYRCHVEEITVTPTDDAQAKQEATA